MKVIRLSPSTYAFEPNSDEDGIEAITAERLRGYGLDDQAIDTFFRYRSVRSEPPPDDIVT